MIVAIMDKNNIKGFTHWDNIAGRGSHTGEPHYGNHAWPTLNGAIWTVIEEAKVDHFLKLLHNLDLQAEDQGLRAFVLDIEKNI